jgi:hypothetical protein
MLPALGSFEGSREAVVISLEPCQAAAKFEADSSEVVGQSRQLVDHSPVPVLVGVVVGGERVCLAGPKLPVGGGAQEPMVVGQELAIGIVNGPAESVTASSWAS